MVEKKTGMSLELLIHPGETIADLIHERGMTQAELAIRTGVSTAYVNAIIRGKKSISVKYAAALEYAFDVPKSFWINLQANYDAEKLELEEYNSITDEELKVKAALSEVTAYLKKVQRIASQLGDIDLVISLRRELQMSNLCNLDKVMPQGAFRISEKAVVNPYVLGAWLRLCQISEERMTLSKNFSVTKIEELKNAVKAIMINTKENWQDQLRDKLAEYGINFSILRNFRGAPVQGYLSAMENSQYHIVLTIRGAFADIFWFSLFHEIGHIVNGDVTPTSRFIDLVEAQDVSKEQKADQFAADALIDHDKYWEFVNKKDFSIEAIGKFARGEGIPPYIVIGRLQHDKYIKYSQYSTYKTRYKWA